MTMPKILSRSIPEGAWSATIVEGGDDFITLRSTVEGSGSDNAQQTGVKSIEGAGEHPIDFWIDFKGTIAENSTPRCAIVRVRYHNYTCEHDIYVRQGYAPITIDGNAESDKNPAWASYNVYRFDANNGSGLYKVTFGRRIIVPSWKPYSYSRFQ